MNTLQESASAAATLALRIEELHAKGLSFSEVAAMLTSEARPLSRAAVLGIHYRLSEQRIADVRDLKICAVIEAKTQSLDAIAKTFDVKLAHVQDLKREAGL